MDWRLTTLQTQKIEALFPYYDIYPRLTLRCLVLQYSVAFAKPMLVNMEMIRGHCLREDGAVIGVM